ncbi:PHD finger protein 14 [Strongyloides ratti]|uniref:PHD finger protein 14 n=1 Tax=Strongyloides ratti TaxID=34506 RepID=A0A090LCX3_STRRB|nr:PHD finger protein 14 [Strongyloides ratti]CEF65978.1 PHD finger protein 14 [Strongyloides ratti]
MSNDKSGSSKNNKKGNNGLLNMQLKDWHWNTYAIYKKEKFNELLSMVGHQHSIYSSGGGYKYYKCKDNQCSAKLRILSKKDDEKIVVFVRQVHTCGYDWNELINGDDVIKLDNFEQINDKKNNTVSVTFNERKKRRKSDDVSGRRKKTTVIDKKALSFTCESDANCNKNEKDFSLNYTIPKKKRKTNKQNKSETNGLIIQSINDEDESSENDNEDFTSSLKSMSESSSSHESTPESVVKNFTRPKRKSAIKAMETKVLLNGNFKTDDDDFEDSDDDDYTEEGNKSFDEEENSDVDDTNCNNQPATSRRFQPYNICKIDFKNFCGFCMKDDYSEDQLLQCITCKIKVHEHCYYVKNTFQPNNKRIISPWFCNECLSNSKSSSCIGCHENHGPMKQTENGWIHGFCALYNNDIYEELVDNLEGPYYSTKVASMKKRSRCIFCENPILSCIGFTIQCEADKCNIKYHPMCGLKYGATFNIFPDDGYKNLSTTHCPLHSNSETEKSKSYSIYHVFKKEFESLSDLSKKNNIIQESHKKAFTAQKKLMDNAYKEWVDKIKYNNINCNVIPFSKNILDQLIDKEILCDPNLDLTKSFDTFISKIKAPNKELTILNKRFNELLSGSLQNIVIECLSLTKTSNLTLPKLNNKTKSTKYSLSDSKNIMTQIYDQLFSISDDAILKVIDARLKNAKEEDIDKEIKFIKSFLIFKKEYLKCNKNNLQDEDFIKSCMVDLYKCLHYYKNRYGSQE